MYYHLSELQEACLRGEKFKFVFFWRNTPPKEGRIGKQCLSQWWESPFVVKGVLYQCAEQYMMAEKARLFQDEEMLQKILKANHPQQMKKLGRMVQNFEDAIWDKHCFDIVKKGNLEKFSQNKDLWNFMKGTKERILVEASPRDRIWGIGMEETNLDAENPMKWRGKNLLGFALMKAREELLEREEKNE